MSALKEFFSPDRLAIVGASESSGWTRMLLDGIEAAAKPVEVIMVNPRRDSVHGHPCVARVADAPGPVDVAFVQVAPDRVLASVEEALDAGVRDFVVLSSGLGETGEAGKLAEARLAELMADRGGRLLGPNVSGFVNPAEGINLFGLPLPAQLRAGGVGLVMQSGGLATHALSLSAQWGIGISRMVTTGNEAAITASDVFADLVEDPSTTAIAIFLESVRDPALFADAATRARQLGKPVVALQAGRSEIGRSSALAHTGALVGDHAASVAGLEGLGVVCVDTLEELIASAGLLARFPEGLPGRRLGVVAASGGACELIADLSADLGLELPELPAAVVQALSAQLPAGGAATNPLDVTGFVVKDGSLVFTAADAFLDAVPEALDALIFQSVTLPTDEAARLPEVVERFRALARLQADGRAPVLLQTAATYALTPAQAALVAEVGIVLLPGVNIGLRAVSASVRSRELRARAQRHAESVDQVTRLAPGPTALPDLMRQAGVPAPPREVVATPDEVAGAASRVGCPVVVKVVSEEIAHKTEAGGVALGLPTPEMAADAARTMASTVAQRRPDAAVTGYEVVAMREPGVELLAAVVADPVWGPMLTVGAGGVLSELHADVATRSLPVDARDVGEMLAGLRTAPLLDGYRGMPGVERTACVEAVLSVVRLWELVADEAVAIEVNPFSGIGDRVEALDLLVEWRGRPS
ncbi:MAG TPA: acetate--CoA ligase family protein [Nocardioides sp.]|uniref:acetate--CoA ligase family protein n=1 Tax=Nocardioides sp. TaxID=35761 RepID=UPI002B576A3C|nr:acetate--CoA ligase family protein [Nocardioides sp.]HTW15803.1 acetate--CoA ligase family protein [Nocardioides sp.]